MITISVLAQRFHGLDLATVETWVAEGWIRPRREAGAPVFEEIDVARIQLILDLRRDMDVSEDAMPVVLSLLDELHATRSRLRRLCQALDDAGEASAHAVIERLTTPKRDLPPASRRV